MNEHLYRSRDDRMLAGVAGGLAEIWDADPSLVRIVWAILVVLTGGLAFLVYIIMAIVVPEGDASTATSGPPAGPATSGDPAALASATPATSATTAREARRAARAARRANRTDGSRSAGLIVGGLLILIGVAFLIREWLPALDFDVFWPLALVALGVAVLVVGLRRDTGRGGTAS